MIGIISDTHENEKAIAKAVQVFKKKNVEFVVHCGDMISPQMLEHFQGLSVKFVFGNNDGEKEGLNKMAQEIGFGEIREELEFEHNGKKFFVYHGTNEGKLDSIIKSNKYNYVLTGHTHIKKNWKAGNTRVINPGALFGIYPYTIAVLDAEKDELEFIKIPQR